MPTQPMYELFRLDEHGRQYRRTFPTLGLVQRYLKDNPHHTWLIWHDGWFWGAFYQRRYLYRNWGGNKIEGRVIRQTQNGRWSYTGEKGRI